MANISDFKAQMIAGGARANQFRVLLTFPGVVSLGAQAGQKAEFLCKAAQLPASTIGNVGVFYRGRQVNFAGDREFAPWTISVYTDNDFTIRTALEQWHNAMNDYALNTGSIEPISYQVDLTVQQLDRNDTVVKEYKFVDAYPLDVGSIQLDFEANNQIETFDVTFQYNYFETDV